MGLTTAAIVGIGVGSLALGAGAGGGGRTPVPHRPDADPTGAVGRVCGVFGGGLRSVYRGGLYRLRTEGSPVPGAEKHRQAGSHGLSVRASAPVPGARLCGTAGGARR